MKKIPIIFGVTGHRDIREQDIPRLKNSIKELFDEYKKSYPNSEIVVLSALADGADILVATVAKECGLTLNAIFPYNQDDYYKTISAKYQDSFRELLEYATYIKIIDCQADKEQKYTHCYEKLGEYLAKNSNILLALWDGKQNNKAGGTAWVVNYQKDGIRDKHFDFIDVSAIYTIKTPRDSNPIDSDFTIQKEYLGQNADREL